MTCCTCPDLEYENHNGTCTVFCMSCHRVHPGTLTEAQAREVILSAIDDHEGAERMHDDEWLNDMEWEEF